jgi:hypothetical protein
MAGLFNRRIRKTLKNQRILKLLFNIYNAGKDDKG